MHLQSITIRERAGSIGPELEVVANGHTTGHLSMDEALGCIASWLYARKRSSEDPPQFMRSYLHDGRYRRRHGLPLYDEHLLAIAEAGESPHRCGACQGHGGDFEATGMPACCACLGKGWV